MGNAHCTVVNESPQYDIPLVTFNYVDTLARSNFHSYYLVFNSPPTTSVRAEAIASDYGLQVCVGFRKDGDILNCRLFNCPNGATLKITSLDKFGNVGANGCSAGSYHAISLNSGPGAGAMAAANWYVKEVVQPGVNAVVNAVASAQLQTAPIPAPTPIPTPIPAPAPANLGDWTVCANSNQCTNQCCSGKYSGGVLKCTPVGGFKTWEGCVGSTSSVAATKQGDWTVCANSNQCTTQCCSSKYSGGVLKCTPVGGFKTWEGCVGSASRNLRVNDANDGEAGELAVYSDVMVEDAFGEVLN